MTVDNLLKTTLEKIGDPVERLKYSGRALCFITYQLVTGRGAFFSDDEDSAQEYTYLVNLFSKTNYIDKLSELCRELKAAGFYGIEISSEVYEQDTGYYHIPIEIKYMEV